MQNFKFKHEEKSINKALGLSDESYNKVKEIIYFSTFTNYFIGRELFDSPDEIPKSLNTVTGDLEKAMSLVKNSKEKDFLLLMFKHYHDVAMSTLAKFRLIEELPEKEKEKVELLLRIVDLRESEKAAEAGENEEAYVSPYKLKKKMQLAKKNLYSFEAYYREHAV